LAILSIQASHDAARKTHVFVVESALRPEADSGTFDELVAVLSNGRFGDSWHASVGE
jgi:hypothetical protein